MKGARIAAMFTARAVSASSSFGSPAWGVPQSKEPPKIQHVFVLKEKKSHLGRILTLVMVVTVGA
jgi:hypothetical protein